MQKAERFSTANAAAGYAILRVLFGMALFMHGAARFIGGIEKYATPTIAGFANVALPHGLVVFTVYAIPYVELIVGALLIGGMLTRLSLWVTAVLMMALIFGTSMEQNWAVLAIQLNYVLLIALLYVGLPLNDLSVDHVLKIK